MLFKETPLVKRTEDGKIWVRTNITHSQVLKYCSDPKRLLDYMKEMLKNYNLILSAMSKNELTMAYLQDWLIRYYSTFMLIHRSYDYILYTMYEMISEERSSKVAVDYMNCLLNSKIDKWLIKQYGTINNSKAFMVSENLVPIPDFTIQDDIKEAINKTERFFKNNNLFHWYQQHYHEVLSRIYLFVIKEWKFVLYKLLSSRCFYFYSHCSDLDIKTVTEISYFELETKHGNQKVIISCD